MASRSAAALRVAWLDEEAVDPLGHDIRNTAHARRDHRSPGCERLDRADGRALVHGGEQEGVEQPVVASHVWLVADEVGGTRDPELVCDLLQPLAVRSVTDHAESRRNAPLAGRTNDLEHRVGVLHPGHAPDPADDERVVRNAVETSVVEVGGLVAESLVERDPETDDGELVGGRDAGLDKLVAHLGAHCNEHVGEAGEAALDLLEERGASRAEVPLENVPVEGVHDDRWTRPAGRERCRAG